MEPTEISLIEQGDGWANYFDTDVFIAAIKAHGVEFCHWRSMRCPVGLIDESTDRVVHIGNHHNCSNGFLYTKAGSVKAILTGNSMDSRLSEVGFLDGSSVSVTLDLTYQDSGCEVYIAPFDRLYLADEAIVVSNWQLVTHTPAEDDKLNFPAVSVQDLVDNQGTVYKQDVDFSVRDGRIHWLTGGPGIQPNTNKGRVYSVRYTYRPYWLVSHLSHEIRVVQGQDAYGNQTTKRMPQAASLQREYVHRDQSNAPDLPESSRHVLPPEPKRYPDAQVTADYDQVRKLLR